MYTSTIVPIGEKAISSQIREAVRLEGVTCTFPPSSPKGKPFTAIRDVSLSVADGEFVSVVGPTGCGKSTILNIVAGLTRPTSGKMEIFGAPLAGLNEQAGYLFQSDTLMPWRTALQNVMLPLEIRGTDRKEAHALADHWLSKVGLTHAHDRFPHQLSGGMRKRVALAQMLIRDPKTLLMDEPFSALDVQTRLLMENEVLALWQADRKSVIFITHDLEEAVALSDRVIVLSAGPGTRPIGDFVIDLPRPRDVSEIRLTEPFMKLQAEIWEVLRDEVVRAYKTNEK
ncbi:ABC transporter ATP-binding protein [Xanthobacter flavus]|uniref:ABC transporter ATP-binding protein n=1 Tax=Xanthobacter flavus TaxID=281 RepID=UPI00372A89F0